MMARLLLDKGANVAGMACGGATALYEASGKGHEAVVRLLLEKGANVKSRNIDGETREAVVQLLLEKGADVEAKDKHGKTALYAAAGRARSGGTAASKEGGRR